MDTDRTIGYHAQTERPTASTTEHVAALRDPLAQPQSTERTTTLLDVLSNALILRQTAPYLPLASLCSLARASKALNHVLTESPDTFRYLDLSPVKSAQLDLAPIDIGGINWRSERMDEALTEDEFYSGPLRGIISRLERQHILKSVATMILDGLAVPADVVREIIMEDRFNVRNLSIREAKHLNERKLMQVLKYAVRPSRPKGTPKLRSLYVFGPMDPLPKLSETTVGRRRSPSRYPDSHPSGVMDALGAQLGAEWNKRSQEALTSQLSHSDDKWWQPSGRMFKKSPTADWAETLKACEGTIYFDAVLCRSPRHLLPTYADSNSDGRETCYMSYLPPAVATIALGPRGCAKCGSCPESPAVFGASPPTQLPLLTPPPVHCSTIRAAQMPSIVSGSGTPRLIVRCTHCLQGRWCERCQKWWCEACYQPAMTLTQLQQQELLQLEDWSSETRNSEQKDIKVYNGLCVETCLVGEMMSGAGEGGMWG